MSVTFERPPLIEALCQFHFTSAPERPWDSTVPGLMYARIRDQFPTKQEQTVIQLEIALGAPFSPPANSVNQMRFVRSDGSAVVQVGYNVLAVNHLPPYPNWPSFRSLILEQLAHYQEIAQPQGIMRAEIRFINRLELPLLEGSNNVNLGEYCLAVPGVPNELVTASTRMRFLQRVEIDVPAANGILLMQSGITDPTMPNHVGFLLDLDFVTFQGTQLSAETVTDWIEGAHTEVEKAFLACFTRTAKNSFGEEHRE
ncbi:MAG: TIGR04255 family protein [Capsulimonadaceae bacterium]